MHFIMCDKSVENSSDSQIETSQVQKEWTGRKMSEHKERLKVCDPAAPVPVCVLLQMVC